MRIRRKATSLVLIALILFGIAVPVHGESRIRIDSAKEYEGMEHSFSGGYEPTITENTMLLVVPFVTEEALKENRIWVGVTFEKDEDSPFYYKTYQKQVRQSEDGSYLYQCEIQLKKDRVNGQYPLYLSVMAQTAEGENLQQEFAIYVEITDGKARISADGTGDGENGGKDVSDGGHQNPGSGSGDNQKAEDGRKSTGGEVPGEEGMPGLEGGQPEGGSEQEILHQPRIIVESSCVSDSSGVIPGGSVKAGSEAEWKLTIKNCGSQAVENMKVTLLSERKDITFEKNSWYVKHVATGEQIEFLQRISVGKKAEEEPVSVQLQFEYEDAKGNRYTSTETTGFGISQPQQAELVNLSFPENVYASDTDSLTFQIQNTGLSVLYNAKVRIEGKGLFPKQELFFGHVEGGTAVDGEIPVFVGTLDMKESTEASGEDSEEKYGDTLGTVIFSYENENGEVVEQRQEFHATILKPQVVELKVEQEEPQTNQWWITIAAGIVLLLLLLLLWLCLRLQYWKKRVNFHERA